MKPQKGDMKPQKGDMKPQAFHSETCNSMYMMIGAKKWEKVYLFIFC